MKRTSPAERRRIVVEKNEQALDDLAIELFESSDSVEDAMHVFAASVGPLEFAVVCGLASRYLAYVGKCVVVTALEADVPACRLSFTDVKAKLHRLLRGLDEAEKIVAGGGPGPQGYPLLREIRRGYEPLGAREKEETDDG